MTDIQTNEAAAPFTAETILAGVRSYCAGRLRLRLPVLKGLDEAMTATIRETLTARPGVIDAVINPRVGSVLLTWDPHVTDLDLTALAQEAAELLEAGRAMGLIGEAGEGQAAPCADETDTSEEAKPACACTACGCEFLEGAAEDLKAPADQALTLLSKVLAPDVIKGARGKRVAQNRLMLLLLTLSMGALTVSGTKAHYVLGTGFLGLLGVHLWQHRKVL